VESGLVPVARSACTLSTGIGSAIWALRLVDVFDITDVGRSGAHEKQEKAEAKGPDDRELRYDTEPVQLVLVERWCGALECLWWRCVVRGLPCEWSFINVDMEV